MKNFNKIILPEINDIACLFSPIGLSEMDKVEFMNRTDTKYLLSARILPRLLKAAIGKYQILEINQLRNFSYRTTYFDTEDQSFFREHLKGKLNRYKVRHRVYESTGIAFLEIKFKSNKKRTIKCRIKNQLDEGHFNEQALQFLSTNLAMDVNKLVPILENRFNRLTLVSNENKERITIDFNLSFRNFNGKSEELPYLAIVELKREGFTCQSPFISLLKQFEIRESGFSKYCIGNAMLHDLPLKNALKPKFIKLNKLKNEYDLFFVA